MVFENQVAGAKTIEPDNEEILRGFNTIGDGGSAPDVTESALDEAVEFFPTPAEEAKMKKTKQLPVKKQARTKDDEEEIRKLFQPFFESKERPHSQTTVKKAGSKSKKMEFCCCFGFSSRLREYFSLYRAAEKEERKERGE